MIGFLILSGCDTPGSGTVGMGAEGVRVWAEGPAPCPEEDGEKDPPFSVPCQPSSNSGWLSGDKEREGKEGLLWVPSSRPQTCASARNNFNRFRKESSLPTEAGNSYPGDVRVGRAGVAGAGEAQKYNLHGARVPAGLEHLTRGLPVRGAGATSRSSCTLPATGLRPLTLTRAPGPCFP